jgi:hypothetical protein
VRIDRGLVRLGLFLLTAGVVALAIREGLISEAAGERAWTLWPLVLVGAGLSLLLAGRPGAWVGGTLIAVTLGAILGGVVATGWRGGFSACGPDGAGTPFAEQNGDLGAGGRVSIEVSCGHLALGTVAGSTWSVTGSSPDGRPPRVLTADTGIRISAPDSGRFLFDGGRNDWSVAVPRAVPVDLDVETNGGSTDVALPGANLRDASFSTNAGSLTLDLREVSGIGDVDVETNLGSLTLRLPNRSFGATIQVNAGSASICAPPGIGLRIRFDSVAASDDFESHGLVRAGDFWQTSGFETSETRIELSIDANAGSVSLDPARECAG